MNSIIQNTKVGMVITDDLDKSRYCVAKVYPYMVLTYMITDNPLVIRRCFSYGDLVVRGLEKDSVRYFDK